VIEFLITLTCEDGTTRTERYRAVTTLLDWRRYPAADLAAAYARRWGIEPAYREACPASPADASSATPPPEPTPAASPSPPPCTPPAAPQAAHYTLTITPPGTPTRQRHDQQQQAANRAATPP